MDVGTARRPQSPLRYKRSSLLNGSLLNPFRSRVPTEQHSRSNTPIGNIRPKHKGAYLDGDVDLCRHRCTGLPGSSSLHLDTRIETIQLMATITPLSIAREYLSAALHLLDLAVTRGGAESHMEALVGLRLTTLDIMARLEQEMLRLGPAADNGRTKAGKSNSGRSEGIKRMGKYTTKAMMIYRPLVSLLHRSMPLREV
ncbi:hypothetical protein BUE80_DR008376 [Diplocarpon rosae]|nr:hypothetical protein BUE80_DR008376 [Diplocarpon rosae]